MTPTPPTFFSIIICLFRKTFKNEEKVVRSITCQKLKETGGWEEVTWFAILKVMGEVVADSTVVGV